MHYFITWWIFFNEFWCNGLLICVPFIYKKYFWVQVHFKLNSKDIFMCSFEEIYTGWPRKNATPTINYLKKTRDRINKLYALLHIKFFFQQDDTKIINFDEGILILWLFFWGNVIFKICHFCLKSHNWLPKIFHCLASPGKVSALALKNEDSMNKEKHSLCNSAVLQYGEGIQRNSSLPQLWLLIQKKQNLKWHCFRKNGSRIKTPSSKSLILVSFCWKKDFLRIYALTNLSWSLISLKLVIIGVAFFLGHPVYHNDNLRNVVLYICFLDGFLFSQRYLQNKLITLILEYHNTAQ